MKKTAFSAFCLKYVYGLTAYAVSYQKNTILQLLQLSQLLQPSGHPVVLLKISVVTQLGAVISLHKFHVVKTRE